MKIRNGFVSNSSSSSFVMYGAKIKLSESKSEEFFDLIDDTELTHYEQEDDGVTYVFIGEDVIDLDDGIVKVEFQKINQDEVKEKVLKFLEPLKIKVPKSAFAMYGGTAYN